MVLARLKRIVSERLSLSAKLFLKELLIGLPRRLTGKARPAIDERPVILVFDERIPTPDRDAGSLRMMRVLAILAQRYRVVFIPFTRSPDPHSQSLLRKNEIEIAEVTDYRRLLKNTNVQAAIVSRPTMADLFIPRIQRLSPDTQIVFDTVDIHFVRLQREHELTGDTSVLEDARRHRDLEMRLAKAADVVWCASVDEKRILEDETGQSNVVVVPTIHELHDPGKTFDERTDLLFVGGFAHKPNEDAVIFFIEEIFPLIKSLVPDIAIDIVGPNPSDRVTACNSKNVRILGFVPDVEPYLRNARVCVAPLRYGGAGTKGKVGEALSHNLPVVTTSIGAEGFGLTDGVDARIADDPLSFANAVHQVYSNKELWQRLADNGRVVIEKNFAPEAVADQINRSVKG